jgi:hypothetical protein
MRHLRNRVDVVLEKSSKEIGGFLLDLKVRNTKTAAISLFSQSSIMH